MIFKYFEEISSIPRGSFNEKAISDYLYDFAKQNNLEVIQDEALNIIIKKPATVGYENSKAVILQGHMDMVCEKNSDTVHNFEKDPIKLRTIDDYIYATDTTLGADNGIALAYMLAILASKDIAHPPLEMLITSEEEVGMGGANALDPKNLKGAYLINLDSEDEGTFLVSCAGGIRTKQVNNITWSKPKSDYEAYTLKIRGLKGGHSGCDIHLQRGNANKLMGRLLYAISTVINLDIYSINGGSKMNAIPRESDAIIGVPVSEVSLLQSELAKFTNIIKNELRVSDANIAILLEKTQETLPKCFSEETKKTAIASLVLIPNGVQSMSLDIKDLVQSSTNLGVVITSDNEISFESAVRSCVKSLKYDILNEMKVIADTLKVDFYSDSDYPEWAYNSDSKLREVCANTYKKMYDKEATISAIHAGLECGLFLEKMPHLDAISFGPNMADIHTPNEHLSISSSKRVYNYLLKVLEELK